MAHVDCDTPCDWRIGGAARGGDEKMEANYGKIRGTTGRGGRAVGASLRNEEIFRARLRGPSHQVRGTNLALSPSPIIQVTRTAPSSSLGLIAVYISLCLHPSPDCLPLRAWITTTTRPSRTRSSTARPSTAPSRTTASSRRSAMSPRSSASSPISRRCVRSFPSEMFSLTGLTDRSALRSVSWGSAQA